MTALAIIIVSYNARADLDRCLHSLEAHPPSCAHEIIVVDNASRDGSAALVRDTWPAVRVIDAGENLGFARACNVAIRSSSAPLVLLLNSDTSVSDAAIDRLVEALLADEQVAVAGPRLVDRQGHVELSFGPMIGPFSELRQKLLGWMHARRIRPASRYVERRTRQRNFPDWVSGACLLVRRADAEAVGLLDERFFLYGEEVDFCAAIRRRGRRVLFTPAAEIQHARGRSAASAPEATERAYRRSQLAFYAKHHPRWVPVLRAYLAVRGRLPPA